MGVINHRHWGLRHLLSTPSKPRRGTTVLPPRTRRGHGPFGAKGRRRTDACLDRLDIFLHPTGIHSPYSPLRSFLGVLHDWLGCFGSICSASTRRSPFKSSCKRPPSLTTYISTLGCSNSSAQTADLPGGSREELPKPQRLESGSMDAWRGEFYDVKHVVHFHMVFITQDPSHDMT